MLRAVVAVIPLCIAAVGLPVQTARITWEDVASLRHVLERHGVTSEGFAARVQQIRQSNARRVREGDLDHLIFYVLQSTRFTTLAPIEPALSAKRLVDGLDAAARDEFLQNPQSASSRVPASVRSRIAALLRSLDSGRGDARVTYFRTLVRGAFPHRKRRNAALEGEYLRVMKFLYEKEFVAQRSADRHAAVAELYRTRGLSTDTAVEAGFLVHRGLGILKSLEPTRRLRRVLIIGPGLDLAPRTALLEERPPESYQPWAVIDALLVLGLADLANLQVAAADINPRVVDHLRRAAGRPPTLTLMSEIRETDAVTLTGEYRDYFVHLGRSVGEPQSDRANLVEAGHLLKSVRVRGDVARAVRAESLDIVTERLQEPPFDLIVATNVLPYFDDVQFMLAVTNIAAMLGPGGVFLHNEARPLMHEVSIALGMPLEQSRHAIVASVRGTAPLSDSIFLHRKAKPATH